MGARDACDFARAKIEGTETAMLFDH